MAPLFVRRPYLSGSVTNLSENYRLSYLIVACSAGVFGARECTFSGDEFPRRLCDPLPPVTVVLYYRWLASGLHDNIISQGLGGHRVYVGIRHPTFSPHFRRPPSWIQ